MRSIPSLKLRGTAFTHDEIHLAQTTSHTMAFAKKVGDEFVPDLTVQLRAVTDPHEAMAPKPFRTLTAQTINTSLAFISQFQQELSRDKAFLTPDRMSLWSDLPRAERTLFAYNHICGERIERYFASVESFLRQLKLSPNDMAAAQQAVNLAHHDIYRNRTIEFDKADTKTHWPYARKGAFVHFFEKLRDGLDPADPKRRFIQNQIDYIYTHKYTPSLIVDENDIENSLGLRAIDPYSRHIVSMTRDTESSTQIEYELLQNPHTGRYAYRDGNDFYHEDTHQKMTRAEISQLRDRRCSQIAFRPFTDNERPRTRFRFDWDGNHVIELKPIETGWWGHCDIKALIETLLADLTTCGGIREYHADTKRTVVLSREDLLEGLAAMLNFDDEYVPVDRPNTPTIKTVGEYTYAGMRFLGNQDQLEFQMDDGRSLPFDFTLTALSEKDDAMKAANVRLAFLTKIPNADLTEFSVNPDAVEVQSQATSYLDASTRQVSGRTRGTTFDAAGSAVDLDLAFELNLGKSTGAPTLIASQLLSVVGRSVRRVYYDPATHQLNIVDTRFVLQPDGTFSPVEAPSGSLGSVLGIRVGREMQENDDIRNKFRMMLIAIQSGEKIAVDSDPGPKVWNGEVHTLSFNTVYRSPDSAWERVELFSDATYGAKRVGVVINKLDSHGNIEDCCEVYAAVDFFWKNRPEVAPLISDKGKWYANKGMLEHGVFDLNDRKASLAAIQDIYDLVYLGFKSTSPGQPIYSLVRDGKRYIYESESKWEADIRALEGRSTFLDRFR